MDISLISKKIEGIARRVGRSAALMLCYCTMCYKAIIHL